MRASTAASDVVSAAASAAVSAAEPPRLSGAQHDAHRSGASPALDTTPPQQQLELFSLNGRPMCRVPLRAPLGHLLCTRDGEMVVASEGALVTVRRLHDLQLMTSDDL